MMKSDKYKLEDEYHDLYDSYKNTPGPAATGALLKKLDPVIGTAIKSYASGNDNPLLRGRARRMMVDSLQTYDPSRASLRTHMMQNLQRLSRINQEQNSPIRVPEQRAIDAYHLNRIQEQLNDENNREVSDAELMDHLGWPEARLMRARDIPNTMNEGNQAFTDEEGNQSTPATSMFDQRRFDAWKGYVYSGLDPVDQIIMEHTLGMRGRPKLPGIEIARKVKLTPAAVSQRAARIQQQLSNFSEAKLF